MAAPIGPVPILTPITRAGTPPRDVVAEVWQRWFVSLLAQVLASAAAVLQGAGDPNGVVTAPQGTLFVRNDGGATTTVYAKSSGGIAVPTNTGWTALS